MHEVVACHREAIAELCRRYGVERLDAFGSATGAEFDPERSDVDFIVRFEFPRAPGISDRYLDLAEALERLLQRPVDLLTDRKFSNPYFARAIAASRETVYERPRQEATG